MVVGSLFEIQNQLFIARDVGYLDPKECELLFNDTIEISKMCSSLIRVLRNNT